MNRLVEALLRRFGWQLSQPDPSPYEGLKAVPRYQETVVELLGRDFTIPDSLSFYHSHREIFCDQIYRFTADNPRPVILDGGSNCGTSIVYFKSLYPGARITGVEADARIFEILSANIRARHYEDVVLINKALSTTREPVLFHREGADSGRVFPLEGGQAAPVEAVILDDLIHEPVDFLKMDIEGAETEVVCSSEKLDRVSNMFVEYHSFQGAPQTLAALLQKLTACGFRYYIHRQFCSSRPLTEEKVRQGVDMQLNIFARRMVSK